MVRKTERNPVAAKPLKFMIDLGVAHEDDLLVSKDLSDFLRTNMKLNGKKNNLKEEVTISVNKQLVT